MKSITITPTKLNGSVIIPPSKSLGHRAIICAALSGGVSTIENIGFSEDIDATINAMSCFGAKISVEDNTLTIDGTNIFKNAHSFTVDCNESGSTLRFLIPLALHCDVPVTFTGKGRLPERPLETYFDIFKNKNIEYQAPDGKLPLTMFPSDLSGVIKVEGNVSSQFISGLLLSLPLFPFDSEIKITSPLESKGYVDMTLDVMEKFGVTVKNNNYHTFRIRGGQKYVPANYTVEGDFSQAAFYLAAGCLGNFIVCRGLNIDSIQGDKAIIDVIKKMGGKIVCENDGMASLPSRLKGCTVDASQIPDLVPIITVLASLAEGETRIIKAERLRIKESDRLSAITEQLNTLGAMILEKNDGLIIEGINSLCGGTTNSVNDHRIAMAIAIASTCASEEVVIENSDCVKKSYPDFWKDFARLGGIINEWNLGK